MDSQNNSETQVKLLTDVCQNVCAFIKTITVDNLSKDEKINSFKMKTDDLQCLYSDLKVHVEQINKLIKKLASLLDFAINQDDSVVDILNRWISSLSNKKIECNKKRKLYSSYSPLKLSLKEKTEVIDDSENKSKCTKFEKENKSNNIWKLPIKRDGNPSDLLKKSKQTILMFQPQKEKVKMDITTFNSPEPKITVSNSTSISSSDVLKIKINYETKNVSENNLLDDTQLNDSGNISLSHFNKILKPIRNVAVPIEKINTSEPSENSTSHNQIKIHNQSCNEVISNSTNTLKNTTSLKKINHIHNKNVLGDSFDIIPGLNDNLNDLPNYKFKENPVRKRNERKLLNGWDCEDCCNFYEANNDNPVEAKTAMNHFSRHRSVKNQLHAPTPPGFWDPV